MDGKAGTSARIKTVATSNAALIGVDRARLAAGLLSVVLLPLLLAAASEGRRLSPSCTLYYRDADGDGYGDAAVVGTTCDGTIPAGWVANATDCNDADATIHPGAAEVCNGIDDDCDGAVDEGSDEAGFCDPSACGGAAGANDCFCWPVQPGATSYQVTRLEHLSASVGAGPSCTTTDDPFWSDPQSPAVGQVFYYVYRPLTPFAGAWGASSSGQPLQVFCGTGLLGECSALDDDYQGWLQSALSCDATLPVTQCTLAVDNALICPCPIVVNPSSATALAMMATLHIVWYDFWRCDLWYSCPEDACPQPTGGICSGTPGRCVDVY